MPAVTPKRAAGLSLGALAAGFGYAAHYATPRPIADLMAAIARPEPGMAVYDPCCGTGRLLLSAHREAGGEGVRAWGQEINPFSLGLAAGNRAAHGLDLTLAPGDSMRRPAFRAPDGGLRRFDVVLGNPMWNQKLPAGLVADDPHGRFAIGPPPADNGDWGWVQHMLASLTPQGRMATILDTRLTAPSGDPRDAAIREQVVARDLLEAVLLCSAPAHRPRTSLRGAALSQGLPTGAIFVLDRAKRHPGQVLLLDGAPLLEGYIKREIGAEDALATLTRVHREWREEPGLSTVATIEEIVAQGHDLTPSRYLATHPASRPAGAAAVA